LAAEDTGTRKVSVENAQSALSKSGIFSVKSTDDLAADAKTILELVKSQSEGRIGDLFKLYQEQGGNANYKTFQRRIEKLSQGGYVNTKKVVGGKEGSTTIISRNKSLDEF